MLYVLHSSCNSPTVVLPMGIGSISESIDYTCMNPPWSTHICSNRRYFWVWVERPFSRADPYLWPELGSCAGQIYELTSFLSV